jgi:hypothetical protein
MLFFCHSEEVGDPPVIAWNATEIYRVQTLDYPYDETDYYFSGSGSSGELTGFYAAMVWQFGNSSTGTPFTVGRQRYPYSTHKYPGLGGITTRKEARLGEIKVVSTLMSWGGETNGLLTLRENGAIVRSRFMDESAYRAGRAGWFPDHYTWLHEIHAQENQSNVSDVYFFWAESILLIGEVTFGEAACLDAYLCKKYGCEFGNPYHYGVYGHTLDE